MLSMPDFHSESMCNLNVFLKHPDAKDPYAFLFSNGNHQSHPPKFTCNKSSCIRSLYTQKKSQKQCFLPYRNRTTISDITRKL